MRSRSRLATALMAAAMMLLPAAALGTSGESTRDWTVLMYFGADNDLYQATEFCVDQTLKALEEVEADGAEVAFVLLIDGPNNGDTDVFELTAAGMTEKTSAAFGIGNIEKRMTDPQTMIEFLGWAIPAYPAEKTMLVLKNGHAWCGICPDDTNEDVENLLMPIDGLRLAIETVYTSLGDAWIDALVFDGDNMGSIEVAYELRKVTSYFVGSQQQVPLEGLPYYLFTKDLVADPAMPVDEACIVLTQDYVKYYNNTGGSKPKYDKLIANSQMYVTAAVFQMGENGEKI
ncbi:MAG: clostripain-related cysteine peptidase, partial [Thermoplasmata archaeon]|nr:clostripain-related cysteine peptidase [Thermoplasmata archaeon]